jgi:hypothetical protein
VGFKLFSVREGPETKSRRQTRILISRVMRQIQAKVIEEYTFNKIAFYDKKEAQ